MCHTLKLWKSNQSTLERTSKGAEVKLVVMNYHEETLEIFFKGLISWAALLPLFCAAGSAVQQWTTKKTHLPWGTKIFLLSEAFSAKVVQPRLLFRKGNFCWDRKSASSLKTLAPWVLDGFPARRGDVLKMWFKLCPKVSFPLLYSLIFLNHPPYFTGLSSRRIMFTVPPAWAFPFAAQDTKAKLVQTPSLVCYQ